MKKCENVGEPTKKEHWLWKEEGKENGHTKVLKFSLGKVSE